MEINDYASKYKDWKDIYNWQTCKTNREEYGKFLCSFLTSTDDSLVVNMNGSWGTGKTELLRRLYVELAEQEHAVVYIDAWESDFSNDALAVVCSELLFQLGHIFEKDSDTAKASLISDAKDKLLLLKQSLNTCLRLGQAYGTVTGDSAILTATKGGELAVNTISDAISSTTSKTASTISESNTGLIESVQKDYLTRIAAMKAIKEQIFFLAKLMHDIYGLKKQIVILVDELDRCRPNYAIEILEVIKHFFQTKGCVFLVATDTEALEHSICAVYGSEFRAGDYLKRFFDRKIILSEVSKLDYLRCMDLDIAKYEGQGIIFTSFSANLEQHLVFFSELFKFDMELRDIDQAIQKFIASLDYVVMQYKGTHQVINAAVLMIGIVEEMKNATEFKARKSNQEYEHQLNYSNENIKTLINLHLSIVVKKYVPESERNNAYQNPVAQEIRIGRNKVKHVLKNEEYLLIQKKSNQQISNILGHGYEATLGDIVDYYQDKDKKYWLWGDYRKIIELSGHIE